MVGFGLGRTEESSRPRSENWTSARMASASEFSASAMAATKACRRFRRYGQCPNSLGSADGRLWFSMATALAVVDPRRQRAEHAPPPIVLQRLLVDDQLVASSAGYFSTQITRLSTTASEALNLNPRYQRLEFDFTALAFSSPEDARFRYRLEGFEKNWNETTGPRKAIYPRLRPATIDFASSAVMPMESGTMKAPPRGSTSGRFSGRRGGSS